MLNKRKKKITIIVIILLLAGGVSAYYFRNKLVNSPIATQPSKQILSDGELDCGTSDQSKDPNLIYSKSSPNGSSFTEKVVDLKNDQAMSCMGQALLNNCQKAMVTIKSQKGATHTEEILGEKKQQTAAIG